jgi:hypothetical protein
LAVERAIPPPDGLWRVAYGPDPYAVGAAPNINLLDSNTASVGHRFDAPVGEFTAYYFSTTLEGCFGEVLARLRPSPAIAKLARREWADAGFMPPGEIAAEWRNQRLAVRVLPAEGSVFVDIEHPETHRVLEDKLAEWLVGLQIREVDVATIRGGDRRLTRLASGWAYQQLDESGGPLYAGIRYLSRLNSDWECWAMFDRTSFEELERRPILREMEPLQTVAQHFGLRVF